MEILRNLSLQMHNSSATEQAREVWTDLIRIVAVFAVIVLHAAAAGFYGRFAVDSNLFQVCNFYNSLVRFCVPVFIMISGRYLLDENREYSLKKLYCKKIFRVVMAYVIWATFYALINQIHGHAFHLKPFLLEIFYGHYHLWFIYLIVGLYIAVPVLRLIAQDEKICLYFIIGGFVFVFIGNVLSKLPLAGCYLEYLIKRLELGVFAGYATYFLLGHWLATHQLTSKQRHLIYILGVISILITFAFNGVYSIYCGKPGSWACHNLFPNTFLASLAVFVFCQYRFKRMNFSRKQCNYIALFSQFSFGIYLIHAFVLEHLRIIGLPDFFIHPVFSIPITSCVTFLLSSVGVYIISNIPILKKYAI